MKCSACGTENQEGASYCRECRTPLSDGAHKSTGDGSNGTVRRSRKIMGVRQWIGLGFFVVVILGVIVVPKVLNGMPMSDGEYRLKADKLADTISLNSLGQNPYEPDSVSYLRSLADEVHDLKPPKQYKKANEALESFAHYCANWLTYSIAYVRGTGTLMNSVNEGAMNGYEKSAQSCLNAYETAMGEPLSKNFSMRWNRQD
jgi:hypothetical protein